jgi:hypothetical protein
MSLGIGLFLTPIALGQGTKLSIDDKLAMTIETKDFDSPLPLKETLARIYDLCAKKGVELVIQVDVNSFRNENPDAPTPYDDEVRLPPIPKTITVGDALRLLISQIKTKNGAMLLRNGIVEIVTQNDARPAALLRYPVRVRFDKTPFATAMRQLSDMTGASILFDPRLADKAQTAINADFRNDMPLEAVLEVVTEMADLRTVLMDGAIYVTTPSNAEVLEKRLRERPAKEKEPREAAKEAGVDEPRPALQELLAALIETKDFQEPMSFRLFMQLMYEKFAAKGTEFAMMVDFETFSAADRDPMTGIYADEVRLPAALPKVMSAATAIRLAVAQLKTPAAMVLRNGTVEVVSRKAATPEALLRYKVLAHFNKVPATDALRHLADHSGITVVFDPRAAEKAATPISASFRGDGTTEAALRMVADMAGLRVVPMDTGVYVTTPENAEAMEKQMRERREEPREAPAKWRI